METIDKASKSAHAAVDKVVSTTTHAAEMLGEKGEQLKNCEQRIMKNCQEYIRDNPVTSLGIAAAAGFLLSRLLSNR